MTPFPLEVILDIKRLLKGGPVIDDVHTAVEAVFAPVRRVNHGHVAATLGTVRPLQLDTLIRPRATRVRHIVLGS